MSKKRFMVFLFLISLLGVGCSYGKKDKQKPQQKPSAGDPQKDEKSEVLEGFAFVEEKVIKPKCLSCHATATKENHGISLASYEEILKSAAFPPLVTPGVPGESSLYLSISRTNNPMPKGGEPLLKEDVQKVFDWIKSGAKNKDGSPPPTTGNNGEPGDDEPGDDCEPDEPGCGDKQNI